MANSLSKPVVIVTGNNGKPVVQVDATKSLGVPATVVTDNGQPIVLVSANGQPMALWNEDGTEYEPA